jgi:hypothetical protein
MNRKSKPLAKKLTLEQAQEISGCETKTEITKYLVSKGLFVNYNGKESAFYVEPNKYTCTEMPEL